VSIRRAGPADLSGIWAVEEAGMLAPWSCGQLESELYRPEGLLLVAAKNGQLVGYIVFQTMAPEAELLRLVVLPDHRQRGWARSLLISGFSLLADQDVRSCFLEVRCSNAPARLLYEQQGFVVVGTRPNYYRNPSEDAILMQYDLNGYGRKDEDNSGS